MKYEILEESYHHDLNKVVNEYLNKGWELHGPTYITQRVGPTARYNQAVTKTSKVRRAKRDTDKLFGQQHN